MEVPFTPDESSTHAIHTLKGNSKIERESPAFDETSCAAGTTAVVKRKFKPRSGIGKSTQTNEDERVQVVCLKAKQNKKGTTWTRNHVAAAIL